jgi:hypothetical protein
MSGARMPRPPGSALHELVGALEPPVLVHNHKDAVVAVGVRA